MNARSAALALVGIAAAACGGARHEPFSAPAVPSTVTGRGDAVYVGRVFALGAGDAPPTYVYERRVDDRDGAVVSTHVTRDLAGAIQLAESAAHSADYELVDYTLFANQLGQTGSIHVDDQRTTFRMSDQDGEHTRVEDNAGPVVVGPTLVGHIVRRLDRLERGEVTQVRMAVLDRLETIGFDLRALPPREAAETRVEMIPSSFFVRLAMDPIAFTFDRSTKKLVRIEGRVPTKVRDGKGWRDFDARVEYDYVAASYR